MELLKLEPQIVWKNFRNIIAIPHASYKEEKLRKFIREFAENIGLHTVIDDAGNLLVKKPATSGMENRKTVILQGHMDMVTQKNENSSHNFDTDPIQAYIEGDWVKARGTTLGADNGIGVSAILAILESTDLPHPAIEALFTVEEEVGMTGAAELKSDMLKGEILLNLDTEDEGQLFIGCGSGIIANITLKPGEELVPPDFVSCKITVRGLIGGHSGIDIHLGLANSNKLLFRFLKQVSKHEILLSAVNGGNLPSAIPRESHAIISFPKELLTSISDEFSAFAETVKREYRFKEPSMKFDIEPVSTPKSALERSGASRLINAVVACPNGVIRYSDAMPGLVETSTTISIIKLNNSDIQIKCLLRSSVESAKMALCDMVSAVFELIGASITFEGGWPGWEPNPDSEILKVMTDVYAAKFGRKPEIKAVHAGLECGFIGKAYPELDMISFGPTVQYLHSPDEKVKIDTVGLLWEFLVETLKNIPVK